MFDDKRSKRVIVVAHCILNQNTKLDRLVTVYPGAISGIADLIIRSGAGILQMPCPEMLYMGLDRQSSIETVFSVASERSRIREKLSSAGGRNCCRMLAETVIIQIEEYLRHGFDVLGIIGINCSPTCGVKTTWIDGRESQGQGVFFEILAFELNRKGIDIPIIGIKPDDPEQSVEAVMELLNLKGRSSYEADSRKQFKGNI